MSKIRKGAHSSEEATSSSGSSSSLSSDEEVDARDLKPIKDYLSDRRELARQLFKSVKAEKIQMMLPQALKKMDMGQLEEWCANELSGMSKARILSILNGKSMAESSDTSESDDSGPSLEIISDTEEWFSDEDISKREEGKGKVKKDRGKQKGKPQSHKRGDNKTNQKKASDNICRNVQIKKEEDAEKNKEKEGDSLLDLLELEMRARAIRALIRKEEDIIPNTSKSTENNDTSVENAIDKTEQDELKEKESCRRQLERIIGAQQNSTVEDEDVVLVVQPTPTIELLSSDSEGESHSGVRINKKLENERVIEAKNNTDGVKNGDANNVHSADSIENSKESKIAENSTETCKELDTHKTEVSKRVHSNNIPKNDTQLKSNGKRRKVKKKSHSKDQSKSTSSKADIQKTKPSNESEQAKVIKSEENVKLNGNEHKNDNKSTAGCDNSLPKKRNSVETSGTSDKVKLDEEKSIDLDEIIDLDDYCDDMDDIENSENYENKNKQVTRNEQSKFQTKIRSGQKLNGTETWASRYYQQDDVQNVIKESKIQSEIRKRLRERQRLSRLSTSPSTNSPSSSPVIDTASNKITEINPLGSVDEYLALKHTAATSLSTGNSNTDSVITEDNNICTKVTSDISTVIESDHTPLPHSKEKNVENETKSSANANVDI